MNVQTAAVKAVVRVEIAPRQPLKKAYALKYQATHADFQSAEDQATISDSLADREKTSSKGEVKVKASNAKPSMDAIKARAKPSVKATAPADTQEATV